MKRKWIKFLCWLLDHRMKLAHENVGWHHWEKWERCARCGHEAYSVEFKY